MTTYNYSYNVLINRLEAFAAGHYLIKRFTHGQIDLADMDQDEQYPFMHVVPNNIRPVDGGLQFDFQIMFADIPRDKELKAEYQREIISDCVRLAQDLIAEVKNGIVLFGFDVQLVSNPTIEPFQEEYKNTLTGVTFSLQLEVPWDWSACDIPATWAVGGVSTGGNGTGLTGLVLKVNNADNVVQTMLNLVNGTNITIVDNGDGSVTINSTGGISEINWGDIGGALADQIDLIAALNLKADIASLGAAAFSNNYNDLDNLPSIPDVLNDLTDVDTTGQAFKKVLYYDGTKWVPYMLSTVAYSGDYQDLSHQPSIPKTIADLIGSGTNPDDIILWNGTQWIVSAIPTPKLSLEDLQDVNVPSPIDGQVLQWSDFDNRWIASTISFNQVNSDWNASSGLAQILNKPSLATVATSGSYNDLTNKPTIPAAQVNSDWNASSGLAQILNKPTIPAAQIQSDWTQANTSALDYIKNKPSVGAGSVTSVGTTGLISGGPITTSGTITTSMNTSKLVGRATAGTGIMEEITVGSGLTLTGAGVLNNTATPTPTGYYGAWQDVTTQSAASSNVGYAMKFGTIDYENQVRMVSDGTNLTRITFDNTGIYNLNFSVQIQNTDNAEHDVTIWIRKNGVDVAGSAGFVTVPKRRSVGAGLEGHTIAGWNYLLSVVAGEYYQLLWSTTNAATVTLQFYAAGSPPPSTASTLAIVTQQSGIMAGTGITAINSLTGAAQTIGVGTSGTDFAVSSSGTAHTLNLPTASASKRGALSSADWSTFNGKQANIGLTTVGTALATLTNPTAISYLRVNADNSVTAITTAQLKAAVGDSLPYGTMVLTTIPLGSAGTPTLRYAAPVGTVATILDANVSNRQFTIPITGTIKNLYVTTSTQQSATGSLIVSINKNGTTSAPSVTFTSADGIGATKSDTSNTLSVTAGDKIAITFSNAATVASCTIVSVSFIIERI